MTDRDEADVLYIASRFRGPHRSGNGGYTAGALARRLLAHSDTGTGLGQAVRVTLRQPPPLDTPLTVVTADSATNGGLEARSQGVTVSQSVTVAHAQLAEPLPAAPAPVDRSTAAAATAGYLGHTDHPFPFCFSCGTQREGGDALRLFAGPVADRVDTAATPWHPGAEFSRAALEEKTGPGSRLLATEVVWAALDCPGAWAAQFDTGRPIVLGRMTAVVHHELPADGDYVVVGECRRQEGRKAFTATAVYDADNRLMAAAEATWLAIDPATFAGLQ